MQSKIFIKLLILQGFVVLILGHASSSVMVKYCCKFKTFIRDYMWFKCPLHDVGQNRALRFCQLECVVNQIGFSNRKHLEFDKLFGLVAGLKATGGQASVDLHQKVADFCKTITEIQMKRNITYEETSKCSPEFSYFLMCFIVKLNHDCPQESKLPTYECKSQLMLHAVAVSNLEMLHKGVIPDNID